MGCAVDLIVKLPRGKATSSLTTSARQLASLGQMHLPALERRAGGCALPRGLRRP